VFVSHSREVETSGFAFYVLKSKSFRCKQRVTFCWTAKSHQKTSSVFRAGFVSGQHIRVLAADPRSRRGLSA
jgi:hypothetical protein